MQGIHVLQCAQLSIFSSSLLFPMTMCFSQPLIVYPLPVASTGNDGPDSVGTATHGVRVSCKKLLIDTLIFSLATSTPHSTACCWHRYSTRLVIPLHNRQMAYITYTVWNPLPRKRGESCPFFIPYPVRHLIRAVIIFLAPSLHRIHSLYALHFFKE